MNLQFVTTGYYPHVGGKSSHIETIINGLEQLGHKCDIVSFANMSKWRKLIVFIKRLFYSPLRFVDFDNYATHSDNALNGEFKKTVYKHLKNRCYDAIIAEDPVAAIISTDLEKQKPVVLVMHSYFGRSMSEVGKTKYSTSANYFENQKNEQIKVLSRIKELIAVDDRIRNECREYAQIINPSLPVVSIENFVDTEKFKKTYSTKKIEEIKKAYGITGKRVITCVRRLCDKNGVIFAVKSMKYLSDDFILLVAGDGPCMVDLRAEIENSNLQNKVLLLGSANLKKVVELYNISDYVLVPSITVNGLQEATSISALEAMSFSLPVIASSIGGLKQMITHRQDGLLVEEKDSEAIANSISLLDNDKELYSIISLNARNLVIDKYSYLVGAKRYEDEVKKAIKDAKNICNNTLL